MNNLFQTLSSLSKSYESKVVWQFMSNAVPSINIDGVENTLSKDSYGYQVRMCVVDPATTKKHYFFAEVAKDFIHAAQNNFPNWKIDVFKASRSYEAVALTNKEIIELADYEAKKAEYDALGVTIDTSRKDQGKISIKAYDDSKPVSEQQESIKLFAVALLS